MLRLVYSNRTEELLVELGTRVRAQQARNGPLSPVRVVVPSAALEGYLRLGVARVRGIAANLRFLLLNAFAEEVAADWSKRRVAGAESFQAMVLTLLLDDTFLSHDDLEPVRAYLNATSGRDSIEVRRVQLADRLGKAFERYTHSRVDLLTTWRKGTSLEAHYAETERWQRRFWLAMFGEGGLGRVRELCPLHEAVAASEHADAATSGPTHVFGFAHFASTFHGLFARVGRTDDIVVYSLSPCEGFWEDVDPRDPVPLHLWGRPGREHVRALDALAGFDREDRFVEPPHRTLLGQLQLDLLRREPARHTIDPGFSFDRDESLRVLEHSSVRRELEAVASEIWRLVESDPTLRFDEIGVLLPDGESQRYLLHLASVFGEAHRIPHREVALLLAHDSRIVEAIELLLTLPLGRFTRQDLLRLAVHPAVVESLDGVDPKQWLSWCDALGIVHGADRADHEGTYIERDVFNWDQGLRRLALGAFMAGDASGERSPLMLGADAYVPYEVSPSDLGDAAALGVLLRSLVSDARFVRDAVLGLKEWASLLGTLVETYIAPARDADAEVLAQCLRRIHALGDIDLGGKRVPYRVARELVRAQMGSLPGPRSGEGVVVSRITSMRAIPLRVVFACGMGEGRFPSVDAEDPLDLSWAHRLPGDVTARERDKYAFLELLLCTRERLYLSYVARDPLTGDTLAPSSVVQELLHMLELGYTGDVSRLRLRHRLRRWDPLYFPAVFRGTPTALGTMHVPEAGAEARALALRSSLAAHHERLDLEHLVERAKTQPPFRALAEILGLSRLPDAPPSSDGKVVVPMYALVKFLEFPLQGWARFRVGLDEYDEDDILARENEPFETELRDETLLLREVLLGAVARGQPLEEAYEQVVRERELRGRGPSGIFASGERGDHLRTLETWREELAKAQVTAAGMQVHRFGRAGEHARVDQVHDALLLDVGMVDPLGIERILRVEITGRTLPLDLGSRSSITLLRRAAERRDDEWTRAGRERSALRAFVDHAVLSASGAVDERPHRSVIVVATPEGAVTERSEFELLPRGEALVWLRGLVREMLAGPHAYFFPCEAVLARQRVDPRSPARRWLEQARDKLRDKEGPLPLRSAYGPVPRPQEFPVPGEEAASAMIASRFGAYFAKRGEPR